MQNHENTESSFGFIARGTSALCTGLYNVGRYVFNIFRDNQPVQAVVAGATTLAMLPIFSRQLKKFEEDVGAADIHSDDIVYPMILINLLITYPFVLQYFLTKLTNYHSPDHHEDSHIAKRAIVLYTAEAAAVLPYLGFLLPEKYNYVAYAALSSGLGLAAVKTLKDYFSAVQQDINSVDQGYDADTLPYFENITRKSFAVKALGGVPIAVLMAFMLYGIELKNSQIEDPDSQVFDQYLAWATAYALPLITATFIQNTHIFAGLNETLQADDGSNSTPNQVIVNASCALSAIGRGICYTSFSQEFFEAIGLPKATALGLAIATSGIIINGAATFVVRKELMTILPRILKSEDTSCKDITKAMFVALEGIVLSSPGVFNKLCQEVK